MVNMDPATAVKNYQFGERAKSELIIVSQICGALSGFPEKERAGGRRLLLMLMEMVRTEIQFALNSTGHLQFQRSINSLNEAISLVESDKPDQAMQTVAGAISAVTTPAQEAWQVLADHGLL